VWALLRFRKLELWMDRFAVTGSPGFIGGEGTIRGEGRSASSLAGGAAPRIAIRVRGTERVAAVGWRGRCGRGGPGCAAVRRPQRNGIST
jgi:hypothetical protein